LTDFKIGDYNFDRKLKNSSYEHLHDLARPPKIDTNTDKCSPIAQRFSAELLDL